MLISGIVEAVRDFIKKEEFDFNNFGPVCVFHDENFNYLRDELN